MSPRDPGVSVVIANWNRRSLLQSCLASLDDQSYGHLQTIVVDNCSSDGSATLVQTEFPSVHVVELDKNRGFAQASNIGIKEAQGEYIALLNNDATAEPDWVAELVNALETHPNIGFCASRMLLWDQRQLVDACWDFYSIEGVAGKIGHHQPADLYNDPRLVFGASAGAAIYRRAMLEDIGLFDEDFFMVHEDSDLSLRAQLAGYKCLYVPTAVVYHHLSATIGEQSLTAIYHAQRNMEWVYLKNMPLAPLFKYWPLHLLVNLLFLVSYLKRGQAGVFIRAKFDAVKCLPRMLTKRRQIQNSRRVSAADIEKLLIKGWLKRRIRAGLARRLRGLRATESHDER